MNAKQLEEGWRKATLKLEDIEVMLGLLMDNADFDDTTIEILDKIEDAKWKVHNIINN